MRNAGEKVTIYTQKQTYSELSAVAVPHPSFALAFVWQEQNPPSPQGKVFSFAKVNSNL